jgi:glycosyltransferase involved in cell wall biosynthesis
MRPFFSIGVTSYKRYDLLRMCLTSILQDEFADFEIIVGNDYPEQKISADFIGIDDPRIRYVNHAQNIGPIHNANALLGLAEGRYFTWLADDDMYLPNFLKIVHASLINFNCPPCIFTSYLQGESYPDVNKDLGGKLELFKGTEFLKQYLLRTIKTIGCYGVFDIEYLRSIGGMEHVGNGHFAPYADNLLIIKASLLESIVFIHTPLVFFRTHQGSVSYSSTNIDVYSSAQSELLSKSLEIFKTKHFKYNYHEFLSLLLKWCIEDYYCVMARARYINWTKGIKYISIIRKYLDSLKLTPFYWKIIRFLAVITFKLIGDIGKIKTKSTLESVTHYTQVIRKIT